VHVTPEDFRRDYESTRHENRCYMEWYKKRTWVPISLEREEQWLKEDLLDELAPGRMIPISLYRAHEVVLPASAPAVAPYDDRAAWLCAIRETLEVHRAECAEAMAYDKEMWRMATFEPEEEEKKPPAAAVVVTAAPVLTPSEIVAKAVEEASGLLEIDVGGQRYRIERIAGEKRLRDEVTGGGGSPNPKRQRLEQ